MADIYGDLDNYNDANVLEELRNENQELKDKIVEYASAMERLQKDFDELATEFKKLEQNYSSLLKTARLEIERKTQAISNLNMEKDMMVLNAIQNKSAGELRRSMRVGARTNDPRLRNTDKTDSTSKPRDERVKTFNNPVQIDHCDKTNSEHKENKTYKPSKVFNRRKSLPALKCDERLREDTYADTLKQYDSRYIPHDSYKDSRYRHKNSKGSGSSTDEKYSSYKESSLETYYKSRDNRYTSDQGSIRNPYENDTSERLFRMATRNHSDKQHESRHRERDNASKYGYRSKSRDRKSYYESNYDYSKRHDDRHPVKHKMQEDVQESSNKRIKHSHTANYSEERAWQKEQGYTDEELFKKVIGDIQYTSCQSPDFYSDYSAQPITEIKFTSEVPLEDPRLRSKKYLITKTKGEKVMLSTVNGKDVNIVPITKSMWNLEEVAIPYALQQAPEIQDIVVLKEPDNKEEITTTVSPPAPLNKPPENIKCYKNKKPKTLNKKTDQAATIGQDKSKKEVSELNSFASEFENGKQSKKDGGILQSEVTPKSRLDSVSMPTIDNIIDKPEQSTPQLNSDPPDIMKSIYENMDISETNNLSMESGEIEDDDLLLAGLATKRKLNSMEQQSIKDAQIHHEKQKTADSCNKEVHLNIAKVGENLSDNLATAISKSTKKTFKATSKTSKATSETANKIEETHKHTKSKKVNDHTGCNKKLLTSKEIVAEDLELSDETNDNQDFIKHFTNKIENDNIIPHYEGDTMSTLSLTNKCPVAEIDVQVIRMESPEDEIKIKAKRKTNRTRLSTKKTNKPTEEPAVKKTNQMKVKVPISTPMKNKFSDLFGDSSSLITPEDLGLGSIQVTSKYDPIIEDAQDAHDIKGVTQTVPKETQQNISNKQIQEVSNMDVKECSGDLMKNEIVFPVPNKVVDSLPIIQIQEPDLVQNETNLHIPNKPEKEPDVVQTIIISTGTQLPIATEPRVTPTTEDSNVLSQSKLLSDRNALIALATSTPHKCVSESISTLPDVSCYSNDSRSSNNTHSVLEKSRAADDDVPDVRIFVKRKKRRVIKKA